MILCIYLSLVVEYYSVWDIVLFVGKKSVKCRFIFLFPRCSSSLTAPFSV